MNFGGGSASGDIPDTYTAFCESRRSIIITRANAIGLKVAISRRITRRIEVLRDLRAVPGISEPPDLSQVSYHRISRKPFFANRPGLKINHVFSKHRMKVLLSRGQFRLGNAIDRQDYQLCWAASTCERLDPRSFRLSCSGRPPDLHPPCFWRVGKVHVRLIKRRLLNPHCLVHNLNAVLFAFPFNHSSQFEPRELANKTLDREVNLNLRNSPPHGILKDAGRYFMDGGTHSIGELMAYHCEFLVYNSPYGSRLAILAKPLIAAVPLGHPRPNPVASDHERNVTSFAMNRQQAVDST